MTTIAYKNGLIAYDSRVVKGDDSIASDVSDKQFVAGGVRFFISGSLGDDERFVACWGKPCKGKNLDVNALVYDGEQLWYCGSNDKGIWKTRISESDGCCIGSGRAHAQTALDMGADAETAVKMAAKRDTCTGGNINTFRLPK
jgi:hypothetical protein